MMIKLKCEVENHYVDLEDLAYFLRDLVFLHNKLALLVLSALKPYYKDYFKLNLLSKRLPKLYEEDRLRVLRISFGSPLDIDLFTKIAKVAIVFIYILNIIKAVFDRKKIGNCKTFGTNLYWYNGHKVVSTYCQDGRYSQTIFGETVVEKVPSFLHKVQELQTLSTSR